MSRFVLVDHSLRSLGGHHFDYAEQALRAAEASGRQVVLATHRRFRSEGRLPAHWRIERCFPRGMYHGHSLWAPRNAVSTCGAGIIGGWRSWWRGLDARRTERGFAEACGRLFDRLAPRVDDHWLFAAISEFDLRGLSQCLRARPTGEARPTLHLQFHFDFLRGREPDYDAQTDRLEAMRDALRSFVKSASGWSVKFYTTCDALAHQYNRAGVVEFSGLAYPIQPSFHGDPSRPVERPAGPLRMVAAGAVRHEKGAGALAPIVERLWDDRLATGRIQLRVQRNKSRFCIPTPRSAGAGDSAAHAAIDYVRHPLRPEEYLELIRGAQIGLLAYDPLRYYARRAGILGEFLAAGVPVVVPGGCWLASQIESPIQDHLESLSGQGRRLTASDLQWSTGAPDSGEVTCGGQDSPVLASARTPTGTADLVARCRWSCDAGAGHQVRATVRQLDAMGREVRANQELLMERAGRSTAWLTRVHPAAATLEIALANAHHTAPLRLGDIELECLPPTPAGRPRGAVGAVADVADAAEFADAVREVADHWEHYRRTALRFSAEWFARHDPRATVRQLCGAPLLQQRAA